MSYPLRQCKSAFDTIATSFSETNLDWLPPKYKESLRPLCQESGKLMNEYIFDLVRLLDLDAKAHTVDAWLDEHPFIFITRDCERVE